MSHQIETPVEFRFKHINMKQTYIACPLMWKTLMCDEHLDDDFVLQSRNIVIQGPRDDVGCPWQQPLPHFHGQHSIRPDCSCVPSMLQRLYIVRYTFGYKTLNRHKYKAYWTWDQFHFVNNLCRMRRPPDLNKCNPCFLLVYLIACRCSQYIIRFFCLKIQFTICLCLSIGNLCFFFLQIGFNSMKLKQIIF